jgi:serine/threonine protein kinase
VTKSETNDITRLAIGDFDTSLRVSASFRNIKVGSGDTIVQDGSQVVTSTYARAPARQENTREKELNTAEKRNLFAQNRPRSTVGTAGFMAPEVLRSKNSTPYGFKADSKS